MKRKQFIFISLLGFAAAMAILIPVSRFVRSGWRSAPALSAVPGKQASPTVASVASVYGKLRLAFEENRDQTDARVKFLAHGNGYTVFLTDDQAATLRLSAPAKDAASPRDRALARLTKKTTTPAGTPAPDAIVRLALVGANPSAQVAGDELLPGKSNYFRGSNPARWQRNVPHYAQVKYRGVYPGIDLVYYGNQGRLESDYVLAPGANPGQIGLRIDGARSMKIDPQGDLLLATSAGDVVLQKPRTYQEIAGERREIATSYVQRGPRLVGLRVAPYDTQEPLIIDPVTALYSTYLGGSGNDTISSIAVDSAGGMYVTGLTTSIDFPVKTPLPGESTFLATQAKAQEAFVSKLKPAGTGTGDLVYSTYLGGTGSGSADEGFGIAVDASGDAFITGTTGASTDFPITQGIAYQGNNRNSSGTAFLTELSPMGSSLVYSSFLGGTGRDQALAIALDSTGNAYITGVTTSVDFPTTTNAFQRSNGTTAANATSAFVARFNTTAPGGGASSLVYSTYFGGTNGEIASGIAADSNGFAYITGQTGSAPPGFFISASAFQSALAGTINAFVAKIDTTGTAPVPVPYSSYLGGAGTVSGGGDQGNGIALDGNNHVYIVGTTGSTNFPTTAGAYQTTNKDTASGKLNRQAFVASFDTTLSGSSSLIYSTYLGGSGSLGDKGYAIVVDSLKQAYVSGYTTSNDFPIISGAPQTILQGQNAFLTVLNPTGTGLLFSTFWGGTFVTNGYGIALDSASPPNMYLAGDTDCGQGTFFTSFGAFQTQRNGNGTSTATDGFITKFSPSVASGSVTVAPTSLNFGSQTVGIASAAQNVTLTNGSTATITISSIAFTGNNAADFSKSSTSTCASTLGAGANCIIGVIFTPAATGTRSGNLVITDTVDSASPHTVTLGGSGTASGTPDFSVALAPTTATVTSGGNTVVTVTVTSLSGFNSAVGLTCTSLPPASSCTLNPPSVTPAANGNVTSTATIVTTKHTVMPVPFSTPRFWAPRPFPILGLMCLVAALLMAWIAAHRGAKRLAFGFALLSLLALTSCSGPPGHGTIPGNYNLTITGKSGTLTHPASFSLTVN